MAANQFGIDLADLYRTTEAVKGARTRNKLSGLQLQEVEREIAERPERERKAQERQNIITGLRQQAVTGDQNAAKQLLAIDPDGGAVFIDAVGKMDDRAREAAQRSIDEMGQLSAYVLQGNSQEEQQRRYQLMYNGVSPEVQAKLPEQYDPQFVEMSLSKAMAMEKILENPKVVQFGGEDRAYKFGRVVDRASRPVKASGSKSGAGDLKSADESLMYRQAGELLGGIFDQQGNITNLDPDTRNRVQAIATEAVKLYREQGNISRTEAVQLAGRKFGLNIPDASNPEGNDPLGIR